MNIFQNLNKDPAVAKLQGEKQYNILIIYLLKFLKNPTAIIGFIKKIIVYYLNMNLYLQTCKDLTSKKKISQKKILLVCLQGLPYQYIQIWNIIQKKIFKDYNLEALTYKKNYLINYFLRCLKIDQTFIEDLQLGIKKLSVEDELSKLNSEKDYLNFKYHDYEVGRASVATYFRSICSGDIQITPEIKKKIDKIILSLINSYENFNIYLNKKDFFCIFTTELYIEEYSAVANVAINKNLKLVTFHFSPKDNHMIIKKVDTYNLRKHHSSININTFNYIKNNFSKEAISSAVKKNLNDRYSKKWYLSNRNQLNKKDFSNKEIFKILKLNKNKKVAVIFSHILYDLIYAYGEDIYLNYNSWLGNTLKIIENLQNTQWLLKIHPSNVWRYELDKQLKNKYEELNVIKRFNICNFKNLKLIDHNTNISPIQLMNISDLCVTVRGTSGVEMATMGKKVICAGTGRYEEFNFVNTPKNANEYSQLLKNFDKENYSNFLDSETVIQNSRIFYHGVFNLLPIKLPFMDVKLQKFKKTAVAIDDFNYLYDEKNFESSKNFKRFLENNDISEKELLIFK